MRSKGKGIIYLMLVGFILIFGVHSAYGAAAGTQKWSFKTGGWIGSSPAISSDGTIYIGSGDGYLYAINPDGSKKWSFKTGNSILSSPTIGSDGTIYVGSYDHYLYAISPNGSKKWSFKTGDLVGSSPTIGSDGTIYVGSTDGYLYAINPNGTEKWSFSTGDSIISSAVIGSDGTIYVGSLDYYLYAINPNGTEKWSFPTGLYIGSSPAIGSDGTIYVGSTDGYLYAINPNGTQKWSFKTGNGIASPTIFDSSGFKTGDWIGSSPTIGSDGTIYVGSGDNSLYAINPNGSKKWSFKTGNLIISSPAIGSDGTIYVGSYDHYLYAINPNGSKKWSFKTGHAILSSPAIGSDGTIYIGSGDNSLYALYSNSHGFAGSAWPMFLHDVMHTGRAGIASGESNSNNSQDSSSSNNTNNSSGFSDISPSSWYYNYVEDIAKAGITTGYPNGTYQPKDNVTRAQMAAFIARAMKLNTPQCSSSPFNDVSNSSWYCKYIKALKDSGATSGYPNGTYKPDAAVTRATMAAFLVKALKLSTHSCAAPPFVDVPIDAWYCPYVQALKDAGITNGYPNGTYKPDAAVTRATMAAFMSKAFLGGGGGSSTQIGNSQAVLGPLSGAAIKAYKLTDLTEPIETLTANKSTTDLKAAGTFTLSLSGIPDKEWILVTASGGNDIDSDDSGTAGSDSISNQGTIHALAKAYDWRNGGNINILTELAWQEIAPELQSDNATSIENKLNFLSEQLLSGDINGDGKIDYQDLLAFEPENKNERNKLDFKFASITSKDKNDYSLIDYIHNNQPTKEQERITSLFGKKLGLPTNPLKMIAVTPNVVLPNNSTVSASSLKVSSFLSNEAKIEDSNKATILMADDSKGNTVLLGYALPGKYTDTAATRFSGESRSTFIRLASGYTGQSPELSAKSTAMALVMMIAGGNSLSFNERTVISTNVLKDTRFNKLVSDISNAIAANPAFLHNLNTPQYASIVTEIKTIAQDALNNYISSIENKRTISTFYSNNIMATRSVENMTPIQPTEINGFHLFSPWRADQPWYWYGSANYINVIAPPFLSVDKYDKELFALANPDNVYYAALFYDKSGRLVNWYFTQRSRTMIEKAVNSGAAQRTMYYGKKIDNNIAHIQFNKNWLSGGWSWSNGASPVRLVHFLDLTISVVDVLADAGPLSKMVGSFTKYAKNIQKGLEIGGCIASITDIMSFGNNGPKDFLVNAVLPALKVAPKCIKPIMKYDLEMGIEGAINSIISSTIPKLAAKVSNPAGWAIMVASAADNLAPFATSLFLAPSTVGYDISWNGSKISSVWRNDKWESSNSSTHTVSGTVSGLASGEPIVLIAKLNNSLNTTPITIPILTNGQHDLITNVPDGSLYTLTVAQDPNDQTCTIINSSGTVSGADVTNVAITCSTNNTADTTPPSVPSGLTATAASPTQINLSWNASTDDVGVAGYKIYRDSNFDKTSSTTSANDTELFSSTQYCYTVTAYDAAGNESAQSNQVCATTLPQAVSTYNVGGNVTGLNGTLVLQNNGANDILTLTSNGSFRFTKIADGSSYNITVKTQPTGQTCIVTNGSGTVSGADVTNVSVSCSSSVSGNSGTPDTTFGNNGVVTYNGISSGHSITIDSQGRILVTGSGNNGGIGSMFIWRYNPDGTPDTTFGNNGVASYSVDSDYGNSITIDSQGRILVTGSGVGKRGDNYNMFIWRYNADGTPDTTFGNNGVASYSSSGNNNYGRSITIDSKGRILVTGCGGNRYSILIWRYNPDGTPDSTFGNNGVVTYSSSGNNNYGSSCGRSVTIDSQGRILVMGRGYNWNDKGCECMVIWRYNPDGTPDSTFGNNGVVTRYGLGYSITIDSQGRILVTGSDGGDMFIWRYNSDGTLDTTFGNKGVVDYKRWYDYNYGRSITIDSKGRILVIGSDSYTYHGVYIWRYNSDGTLDTTFGNKGALDYSFYNDTAFSSTIDSQGRILVTGYTDYDSGHGAMAIWRYLP